MYQPPEPSGTLARISPFVYARCPIEVASVVLTAAPLAGRPIASNAPARIVEPSGSRALALIEPFETTVPAELRGTGVVAPVVAAAPSPPALYAVTLTLRLKSRSPTAMT